MPKKIIDEKKLDSISKAVKKEIKKKKKIDPAIASKSKIKKGKTSYMYYYLEQYDKNYKNNQEFRFLKVPEIGKLIGQKWKNLTESEKQPYVQMMKDDKQRYLKEMEVDVLKNEVARLESKNIE